nr:hypothetical protein [Tanacetum cinerariifolium]
MSPSICTSLCERDCVDTMVDVNVNAPAGQAPTMAPPMHTDDQILPHIRWVPIGKNEQWFDLTKDTLRDALHITPFNNNQAFTSPPSSDALINFVNELGYLKLVRNLSNVVTNDMFQPWRALTKIINLCLTGKTSGFERPRAPRKYKFHPRPDSPLHLPNEEHVLGYLKFSAKGTKREVFMMPIPGSDPDSLAPKPTKTARKPKPTAPKADPRPPISKPVSFKQPEPKSAPAKTQGKKCKLTTEISDKPSKAKKSRPGLVSKTRKPFSSLRSVDKSVAEDVLANEPRADDEEADMQKALEEILKSMYDVPRGPLPPVVIRELESGKYQPLPEKSPDDRYIFQKRTSIPIGSFRHDESSSLYAELGLIDNEEESKEVMPGADARGQAGPNPANTEASQPMPSHVVHAGSDREHMDLDVVDVSTKPPPEQMDEGFTATAYLKV